MQVAVGGNLVRRNSVDVQVLAEVGTIVGTALPLPLVVIVASIESEADKVNATTTFIVELASPLVDDVIECVAATVSSGRSVGTAANVVDITCSLSRCLTTVGACCSLCIGEVSLCKTEEEEVGIRERSILGCCTSAGEVSPLCYAITI